MVKLKCYPTRTTRVKVDWNFTSPKRNNISNCQMTPVTKQEESNKRLYSTKRKKSLRFMVGYCSHRLYLKEKQKTVKTDNELMVISAQSFSNMLMWICHTCFLKPLNTSFLGFVTNAFRSAAVFFYHSQPSDYFLRSPQLKMYLFGTNPPEARGKNRRVSNTHFQKKFLHFSNSSWSTRHCSSQLLSELTCLGAAQRRSASQNRTNSLSFPPPGRAFMVVKTNAHCPI